MITTVLAKDLKSGMIIKCEFVILTINKGISICDIQFLTRDCKVLFSRVDYLWDYEVFR